MNVARMGLAGAATRFKRVFESPDRRRAALTAAGGVLALFLLLWLVRRR